MLMSFEILTSLKFWNGIKFLTNSKNSIRTTIFSFRMIGKGVWEKIDFEIQNIGVFGKLHS